MSTQNSKVAKQTSAKTQEPTSRKVTTSQPDSELRSTDKQSAESSKNKQH